MVCRWRCGLACVLAGAGRAVAEVDILGSIHHPQIMRLYRVFADLESCLSDDIVLILEYLSG